MAKRKKASSDFSSSSNEDEDWQESGKSHAKSKPKQRVKKISREEEEEKEEGEVEDEDEDEDSEGFNDGYDDNLIGDEEDQIRLANMNEKEREMELFARSEKREVLKTRYEIERKLRMAKKKEMMQSQTKMRSNERRRNMEEKRKVKNAIKGLKEQREKRKQKQRLRASDVYSSSSTSDDDDDEKPIKKKSSSSSSSSSSSDESDDDKGRRRSDKDDDDGDGGADSDEEVKEKEEDFVLTLEELTKIRLSRFRLAEWCHAPFFRDTVVGCFIKVFIGYRERSTTDEKIPVYKLAQIISVQEGPKIYNLEKTRTNKSVTIKHANDVRNFRLEFVSNNTFSQTEFDEWKYRMERDRLELPGKDLIGKKQTDILNAVNYSYKDSDIEAIVREKEKYKSTPVNFAVKKTELLKQKEMAEQLGNLDDVERITQEIDDLESKAKELDLKRTQNISAISYINERNRMRNIKESEIAIMEAREKEKEQVDDPFRRRKCAPMLVHKFGRAANTSTNSTPGNIESSPGLDSLIPKPGSSPLKLGVKLEKDSGNPGSPKQNEAQNNDLYSAHNFEIQIDVDIGGSMNHSTTSNASSSSTYSSLYPSHSLTPTTKPSAPRRSLNLDEYKKKKGLI